MNNEKCSRPPVTEPVVDDRGQETHPAFGRIQASRISISPPGGVLFDSDIRHQHTVRVRIHEAIRQRDISHDWIHDGKQLIEVEMSEAQWASFVSSMNTSGVSCTLCYTEGESRNKLPHAPRLAQTIAETHEAAERAFAPIREAMAAYDALDPKAPAKVRRGALDYLRHKISNATPNVDYAGKRMIEHTEDVVTKARADIEAFVVDKARALGMNTDEIGPGPLLALRATEDDDNEEKA